MTALLAFDPSSFPTVFFDTTTFLASELNYFYHAQAVTRKIVDDGLTKVA